MKQRNRIALALVTLMLATMGLPVMFGYDPTGIAGKLGLTSSKAKSGIALQKISGGALQTAVSNEELNSAEIAIPLSPGEEREVRAVKEAGKALNFRWMSDGGDVFHEQRKLVGGEYASYRRTNTRGDIGELVGTFDGLHGWFWKNVGPMPVTIKIRVDGSFVAFGTLGDIQENTNVNDTTREIY